MRPNSAIAIAAHPDDIEFMMAGTLLLLKERGWEIHCFNLSTDHRGSARHSRVGWHGLPAGRKGGNAAWNQRACGPEHVRFRSARLVAARHRQVACAIRRLRRRLPPA